MSNLQPALEQLIAPWQAVPGVAVCIVSGQEPPVFACSGYASLEYQLPITLQTRFNIASVSKQFSAFCARLLEKRGLLRLDDFLCQYLPDLPQAYHAIQIHHLLHHTSGLRDMYNLQAYAGFRRDDVFTREQLLALTWRLNALNFQPGERFNYNNTGYILLAEVIHRLTGMPLCDFLEQEIFHPLGMNNTFLCANHKEMITDFAGHYNPTEAGGYVKAFENVSVSGSTNIITSISDFARWLGNYVNPTLEPDVMRSLNLTHPLNDGKENNYACGLELSQINGRDIWSHGGGAGGFRSEMLFVPDTAVAVGVLSNNGSMNALTLARKALALALPELGAEGAQGSFKESAAFSEAEGKDLPGVYRMPDGLLATVENVENQLFIHTPFYPVRLPLTKTGENRYKIEMLSAELESEFDEQGKVCAFFSVTPLGNLRAVKLPPIEIDEAGMAQYAGKYWNEELLNMWEVGISQGRLAFFHPHHPEIVFFPVLQDEFSSRAENFEKLKFIRNEQSSVIAFELSGDRAFNIRFQRVREISCFSGLSFHAAEANPQPLKGE